MKYIVVLIVASFLVAAQALTDEQKAKIKEYHEACVTETKIDKEVVKKAKEGVYSDEPILKEYFLCMSKKMGFQNDAGELLTDVVKSKIEQNSNLTGEKLNEVISCAVKKDTPQLTAFNLFKCWQEHKEKA